MCSGRACSSCYSKTYRYRYIRVYFNLTSIQICYWHAWYFYNVYPRRFKTVALPHFSLLTCLVYHIFPVSLDCSLLIVPSIFSNVYLSVSLDCPFLTAPSVFSNVYCFSRKSVVLRGETLASIFQHIYHRSTYTTCSCLKIAASSLQKI
jgi:hypothetical protein